MLNKIKSYFKNVNWEHPSVMLKTVSIACFLISIIAALYDHRAWIAPVMLIIGLIPINVSFHYLFKIVDEQ